MTNTFNSGISMPTPPLLMLYSEWLRQGPAFPMMAQLCRYFSYTYQLNEVHYYQFSDGKLASEVSFPLNVSNGHHVQAQFNAHNNKQNEWYTVLLNTVTFYCLNVYNSEDLVGVYKVTCKAGEALPVLHTTHWLVAALQWEHQTRWRLNEDWKFAHTSSERWMVVTKLGVEWFNPSIAPWFTDSESENGWPAWIHQDAVIRNTVFWDQMALKNNWTGVVSGNAEYPSTWWYVQKLEPERYLVRVNTYEELTTNLLAQSHWQRHDPLTALPRDIQMQWAWKNNDNTDDLWSIALITIDSFPALNRAHGAEAVDKGLLTMVDTLRKSLPATWSLWRGQAEQFYAMGPNASNDCFIAVLRLNIEDNPLTAITASVGIGTDMVFSHAKKLAQEAAEQAIAKGGQQLVNNSYKKRIRCQSSLKEAMAAIKIEKDLALVYDPIHKSSTIGFRLHTNWTHPTWGVINGSEFLPHCEHDIRQDYFYWVIQQLTAKSSEWKTLGLSDTQLLWPLPDGIWKHPGIHDILNRDWGNDVGQRIQTIFEIDEHDAYQHFELLQDYYNAWKFRGFKLCISLKNSSDVNILKLLRLQPDYISLPWPFVRNASVHKAITEIISFVLNRGINVIAYCPYGVGAPQLFSGVIQQKLYH